MIAGERMSHLRELLPSLDRLPPALRDRLANDADVVALKAGDVVFRAGEDCPGFVVVTSGTVKVSKLLPSGREILLYRVSPGDTCVLTASCLLGDHAYPAQGVAETDLEGVQISTPLFHALVGESSEFREEVFRLLGARVVELMALVEEVVVRRLDQRVARHLAVHVERSGSERVEITHRQLADELGTSREIVSRVLEALAARGFVQLGRRRIDVPDPVALSRFAETPAE